MSTTLEIHLRHLRRSRYTHSTPPIPFGGVWPRPGDPAWDTSMFDRFATPSALRALSAGGTGYHFGDAAVDLLPIAADEGFLGVASDLSTPETALTSLYAVWTELEVEHLGAFDAFLDANLAPGETWTSISAADRVALLERADAPRDEVETLIAVSEQILARWPEHPVADHARFGLIRAEMPRAEGATWRSDEIARLLDTIEDPRIREQAALSVTGAGAFFDGVDVSLLDTVARVSASTPQDNLRLLTWGVNRAVYLEDWSRAEAWSARLRAALTEACGVDAAPAGLACDQREHELRDVTARLVALEHAAPTTWQEALTAEAWRCHLAGEPHRGTSVTEAVWDGAFWAFGPWDQRTPTTDCLAEVHTTKVAPELPITVRLTVRGG